MQSFLSHFVHRPIQVLMVALTILVLGTVALTRLESALLPAGMSGDRINLWINAGNMTPQEVEEQIYAPLEGLLLTIPGVSEVHGYCRSTGVRVFIQLENNFDPKLAAAEVRDRIQRARASWPSHVDRWFSWRETSDDLPLFYFGIGLPDNSQHWHDLVDDQILPKLEAIEGVGEVMLWGRVRESIRILFDRNKLSQAGINFSELLDQLSDDNSSLPIGEINEGENRYLVRADLFYKDLETIRELPIGNGLKIRDVAEVRRVRSFRDRVSRVNGKTALYGMIRKTASVNTIATSKRVRAFFDEIVKEPRFAGLKPIWDFDQGEMIENAVNTLKGSLLIGGCLAFLVLLLFLRRLDMTLVIILSLPLSLLVALTVLYFRGDSLNILVMVSLTIAIGMLVDNSVVVLENIFRLREKGLSWNRACIDGVHGVGNAVALATLTSVAIFLPIMFLSDSQRVRIMGMSISLPLCVALIASLFVALILLPATIAFTHRKKEKHGGFDRGGFDSSKPVKWSILPFLTKHQVNFLAWALRHRLASILLLAGVTWGMYFYLISAWETGVQQSRRGQISINWDFPHGLTLADANTEASKLENWLLDQQKAWQLDKISLRFNRTSGSLRVSLPKGTRQKRVGEVVKLIKANVPELAGIKTEVWGQGIEKGEEAQEGERGFMILLRGPNSEHLRTWSDEIGKTLLANGLAENIDFGATASQDELRINIDRSAMQELGVDPRILFRFVSSGLSGQRVSRFPQKDGPDLEVIAEFSDAEDMQLKLLKEMQIWSRVSGRQRLGDLASFEFTQGYSTIRRVNGKLTASIGGSRVENVSQIEFEKRFATLMSLQQMPRGFEWELGGRRLRDQQANSSLKEALGIGILLVFLVMGLLFESVVLPFAVIGTIPLAIMGGLCGLFLMGGLYDPMVILGLMILAGVIVNNGIVFLDHVVRLQKEGLDRTQAILQGVRDRLRPILMTATTTIVGLMPMAFRSEGDNSFTYVSMALVIGSGLLFATFLTPFIVSLSYSLLDDARQLCMAQIARASKQLSWLDRRAPQGERPSSL